MLFNRGAFNRSAFNRDSSTSAAFYGAITWKRDVTSSQPLWTVAPLQADNTGITYDATSALILYIPYTGTTAIVYNAQTDRRLWSDLALTGSTGIAFSAEGEMQNSHTYSFTLKGLNLQPYGSVVIDTDTLDIFVNGILNVTAWQHGGEFFELAANQDNNIQVYTDGDGNGELTVQWKDRWY